MNKDANYTPTQNKYLPLTPFKGWVLNNFPFIAEDFDALTYYEMLCKVVGELNKVIKNQNLVETDMTNLFTAYNQLQTYVNNYFDNLDVQEEINHKLDEMAETGYFENILTNYLNIARIYNTTDEMIADSTNLVKNQKIQTMGYHQINDGGKSIYIITDDNTSSNYKIDLGNNLYAEIISNEINLMQYGCYGDGVHDDTTVIQNVMNIARLNKLNVISPQNKTYLINETINISNVNIDLNNATIITNSEIHMLEINTQIPHTNYKNITIDLNNIAFSGIKITEGRKINYNNFVIKNISHTGVIYNKGYEMDFKNINMYGTNVNSIGFDLMNGDSNFTDIFMQDVVTAIQTTNVLNKFTRVHAWIDTTEYYAYSKFFNIKGKAVITCNDCYSDTMRYFINIAVNGIQPIVLINGLKVLYANWIYTDNTMESYIFHGITTPSDSGNVYISNSFIQGIENYPISLSNLTFMGILTSNVYSYLQNMPSINVEQLELPNGVTADVNRINKTNNIVEIQAILHFNIDNLSSRYINLIIPNYAYKPKQSLLSTCYLANSSAIGDQQTITPLSLNIPGQNANSFNISFHVPNTISGNCSVSINTTYVKNIN